MIQILCEYLKIFNEPNLNKNQKILSLLDHFQVEDSSGRYIYYGMHNPNKGQLDLIRSIGDVKIIYSIRDPISSFCSRIQKEKRINFGKIRASFIHSLTFPC